MIFLQFVAKAAVGFLSSIKIFENTLSLHHWNPYVLYENF